MAFVCRVFFTKLNECETDDDVAMCFLKNKEGFEKYLQYLIGQGLAESAVGDRTVHRFFKVAPQHRNSFICFCALQTTEFGRFQYIVGVHGQSSSQQRAHRSSCTQHQRLPTGASGEDSEVQSHPQGDPSGRYHPQTAVWEKASLLFVTV